jgi:hypothetical protein
VQRVEPEWNAERAAWLVGKQALVGITHMSADGKTVVSKEQFHGMILSATEGVGIAIVCLSGPQEGKTVTLPPVTTPYLDAKPGQYRLKATGDVVENPDVTVSWTITAQRLT